MLMGMESHDVVSSTCKGGYIQHLPKDAEETAVAM